ncbi:MAG: DUF4124 domain-containing protein, partial [Pseudomonadota bacterium]
MIRHSHALALVFLTLAPAPAVADLYGFVDQHGRVHMSTVAVDERYVLYKKDKPEADEGPARGTRLQHLDRARSVAPAPR